MKKWRLLLKKKLRNTIIYNKNTVKLGVNKKQRGRKMKKKIFFIFFIMILLCFFGVNMVYAKGCTLAGGCVCTENCVPDEQGAYDMLTALLEQLTNYAHDTSLSYQERYRELLSYSGGTGGSSVNKDMYDRSPVIQDYLGQYCMSLNCVQSRVYDREIYEDYYNNALKTYFLTGLNQIMANEILIENEETGEEESVYIDPESQEAADATLDAEEIIQNGEQQWIDLPTPSPQPNKRKFFILRRNRRKFMAISSQLLA